MGPFLNLDLGTMLRLQALFDIGNKLQDALASKINEEAHARARSQDNSEQSLNRIIPAAIFLLMLF